MSFRVLLFGRSRSLECDRMLFKCRIQTCVGLYFHANLRTLIMMNADSGGDELGWRFRPWWAVCKSEIRVNEM